MAEDHAVFDASKVDVVAISADGIVELFIVQDQPWSGSDDQLTSLQEKVNSYAGYALDGAMVAMHPDAAGKPWRVVIHSQSGEPDGRTQYVINALNGRLEGYGGSLAVRTGDAGG